MLSLRDINNISTLFVMQSLVAGLMFLVILMSGCATPRSEEPSRGAEVDALEHRWTERVTYLAGEGRPSRGLGEPGLEGAGQWIAGQFASIGLERIDGSYVQEFTVLMPSGEVGQVFNVLGAKPATEDERGRILIGAHYDSLGSSGGEKHPGADDNASGVATLLTLAETLPASKHWTVVFVAFTAEEAGFFGSTYFVEHAAVLPDVAIIMDMVGRMDGSLVYMDAPPGALREILEREMRRHRMKTRPLGGDGRSDALPFQQKGVDTVVISSGLHEDYHRPTDTVDRLRTADSIRMYEMLRVALVEWLTTSGSASRKAPHSARPR